MWGNIGVYSLKDSTKQGPSKDSTPIFYPRF
jgi:hypothetical protein